MQLKNRLIVATLIVGASPWFGCEKQSAKDHAEHPAQVEPVGSTGLHRVTLTERAIQRIGLKTAEVGHKLMTRTRLVAGEVVSLKKPSLADRFKVWIRARLSEGDLREIARGAPVHVFAPGGDDDEEGLLAESVDDYDEEDGDSDEDKDEDRQKEGAAVLSRRRARVVGRYYALAKSERPLANGQRVHLRLPLSGSGTERKVVPYSALIYDSRGQTWVYTSPESRAFVRHKVEVDYIQDDLAVLKDGPPAGTVIAAVGAAELYGTEFKVGH